MGDDQTDEGDVEDSRHRQKSKVAPRHQNAEDGDFGSAEQQDETVHPDDQHADLGRPRAEKRDVKNAGYAGSDIGEDRQCMVARQREQGRVHAHEWRQTHANGDQQVSDDIDGLIDEIPIFRPLDLPDARQGPIERIARPVQDEAEGGQPQELDRPMGEDVSQQGDDAAEHAESRDHVGRHGSRQRLRHPDQQLALEAGKEAVVDTQHWTRRLEAS